MEAQIPQAVLDYLEAQMTLTLATHGDDGPWAATLTYVNDGPRIFIWTRPQSNSAKHLEQNQVAAFTIDEYTEDWRDTKGIQGRGACTPLAGEDIARAADLFGRKYPQLRPGSTSAVVFYSIDPDQLEFIDAAAPGDEFGVEYRRQSVY